jgi:hypothetical protein
VPGIHFVCSGFNMLFDHEGRTEPLGEWVRTARLVSRLVEDFVDVDGGPRLGRI